MIATEMTPAAFDAHVSAIPYVDRGMFFSELYLFSLYCWRAGVTAIIESGVRNGLSTRVLHALWPDVTSIERRLDRLPEGFPFEVLLGDGLTVVPELVADRPNTSLGVLIDGPKGEHARLLRELVFAYPNVLVAAIHDQPKGLGEHVHTTDAEFRPIREALDRGIPEEYRLKFPEGPGLSIWWKS